MVKPYLIVDGHEDIAYGALALGRDFRLSAHETRAREPAQPIGGIATLGLPDLLAGNVRIVFATIYASPQGSGNAGEKHYETPEEAEALAREQLAYYAHLASDPRVSLITSVADLERVIATESTSRLGLVLLMEGADPIVQPTDAPRWFEAGVRIIGPAWRATRYAGGTGQPGPLTPLGRALMPILARTGFILDTSHLAEESFFEALDLFDGVVIASHSNVRARVPTDRHLSDAMIRALIQRDGVIGLVLYNQFLVPQWRESGAQKEKVTLSCVVDHLKYICDLAGSVRHCGIGSDFDGGFGMEATPQEIDTVADLQRLGDVLADAGFKDEEIRAVLGENWLRVLRRGLPNSR